MGDDLLRVAAEVLCDVMFKRLFVVQQVEALRIARPECHLDAGVQLDHHAIPFTLVVRLRRRRGFSKPGGSLQCLSRYQMRMRDLSKVRGSIVKLGRIGVAVRKTGLCVNGVN